MAPLLLVSWARPDAAKVSRQQRLAMNMGMGGGGSAGLSINGKLYDINRVDEQLRPGDVEIWEVSG